MNATELKAGPELDALVAEKVMGWEVVRLDDSQPDKGCDFPVILENYDNQLEKHDVATKSVWSPSTDIAAAWEVVEKMANDWGCGHYIALIAIGSNTAWLCGEHDDIYYDRNEDKGVIAVSAPLAICLYALKAAGVIK